MSRSNSSSVKKVPWVKDSAMRWCMRSSSVLSMQERTEGKQVEKCTESQRKKRFSGWTQVTDHSFKENPPPSGRRVSGLKVSVSGGGVLGGLDVDVQLLVLLA